jgi:hypothetical protein
MPSDNLWDRGEVDIRGLEESSIEPMKQDICVEAPELLHLACSKALMKDNLQQGSKNHARASANNSEGGATERGVDAKSAARLSKSGDREIELSDCWTVRVVGCMG